MSAMRNFASPPPTAGQRSNPAYVAPAAAAFKRSSFKDLTEDEAACCDDLIATIHLRSLRKDPNTVTARHRKRFWGKAFEGWDTDSPIPQAARTIARRSGLSWSAPVGYAKRNLVSTSAGSPRNHPYARARAASGAASVIPAHRQQGALIYMKCSLNKDVGFPTFMFVDARQSLVASCDVDLFDHLNQATARALAMDTFDRAEIEQTARFNLNIALEFARTRLKRRIMRLNRVDNALIDQTVPLSDDKSLFQQLDLMRSTINRALEMMNAVSDGLSPLEPWTLD